MAETKIQDAIEIKLKINGKEVTGHKGQTILDVCKASGIHVPTLCHCEGLKPVGGCRLCIVEIEGQRRLNTACTTPAVDGMVVATETPRLRDLRKRTLELLFSERNHICPFCPSSGQCELQLAGYDHGITHVRYDYLLPRLGIDNSHPYRAMDHNRCILCGRCIRVCDEWVGAHTLDLSARGSVTLVAADNGAPLGKSSCVSCGMCVEVCPTGALFDKLSNRTPGRQELPSTTTVCTQCGLGCWTSAKTRGHTVLQIDSGKGPGNNQIICGLGRYDALVKANQPALQAPKLKKAADLVDVDWKAFAEEVARRITSGKAGEDPTRVAAMVSPSLPLETIALIKQFFKDVVHSDRVGWAAGPELAAGTEAFGMNGKAAPLARLTDLEAADMIVAVGVDLQQAAPVAASTVRRGINAQRAQYIEINPRLTALSHLAAFRMMPKPGRDPVILGAALRGMAERNLLKEALPAEAVEGLPDTKEPMFEQLCGVTVAEIKRLGSLIAGARKPILVIGTGLTAQGSEAIESAINLAVGANLFTADGRYMILEIPRKANTTGARMFGKPVFSMTDFNFQNTDVLLMFLGDDEPMWPAGWIDRAKPLVHVSVFTAHTQPVCEVAHSIAPVCTWAQRSGTFVNLEGRLQKTKQLVEAPSSVMCDADILKAVAKAMGKSFEPNIAAHMPAGLKVAEGQFVPTAEPVKEIVTCKSKAAAARR